MGVLKDVSLEIFDQSALNEDFSRRRPITSTDIPWTWEYVVPLVCLCIGAILVTLYFTRWRHSIRRRRLDIAQRSAEVTSAPVPCPDQQCDVAVAAVKEEERTRCPIVNGCPTTTPYPTRMPYPASTSYPTTVSNDPDIDAQPPSYDQVMSAKKEKLPC